MGQDRQTNLGRRSIESDITKQIDFNSVLPSKRHARQHCFNKISQFIMCFIIYIFSAGSSLHEILSVQMINDLDIFVNNV